ncbi:hypothetical protein V2J09_019158 [Rumex salicifolius]
MLKATNLSKEDVAGFVPNPDAEIAQVQTLPGPWWVPSGFQPPHQTDDYNNNNQHLNPNNTCLGQLGASQDQLKSGGNGLKTSPEEKMDSQNHQGNNTNSSPETHQQNAYFQIRLGQPMVSMTNSSQPDQLYGPFPGYGPQPMGSVMLPMSLATVDGTVYVNPKQYHRILCRRKIRAKAALKLKARQAKDKQPYVHESRHLHAMRRPRGAGGRFLTSKELQSLNYTAGNDKAALLTNKASPRQQFSNPSRSSSSEVLQGEMGNLNSPTSKGGKSNPYGSEVTSVLYSRQQLEWFHHQIPSSVVVEDVHGCFDFLKA